jgi:DNA-directed RNA polymerase subunit M/transcription elongation factor TFIIS
MDIPIFLLGALLGLVLVLNSVPKEQRLRETHPLFTPPSHVPLVLPDPILPTPTPLLQTPSSARTTDREPFSRNVVQTWRGSVVGLVRLAERNLRYAKQRLERMDDETAVELAMTSVENVSRALLHCYGDKPDLGSGQVEALTMLDRRFSGQERIQYQQAVQKIAQVYRSRLAHKELLKPYTDCTLNQTRAKTAESILDTASEVFFHFSRIIRENFAAEIPQLGENCPKCHTLDVSVMCHMDRTTRYACTVCGHSWDEPGN